MGEKAVAQEGEQSAFRNSSPPSEGNQAKKLRPNRMLFLHPLPRDLLLLRVLLESEDDGVSSRGDAAESG